jgi:hypothetical protein
MAGTYPDETELLYLIGDLLLDGTINIEVVQFGDGEMRVISNRGRVFCVTVQEVDSPPHLS